MDSKSKPKGEFTSLEAARKAMKRAEKQPKYRGCYFYIDTLQDGSFNIRYSDPGLGTGW